MPLTYAGFDASVLSEFRTRLVAGNAEHLRFDSLLSQFREHGLLHACGCQRSDSTHVLAAVRALNRLACVGSTLRHALNGLALVAPDWLLSLRQPEWLDRDEDRLEDYRLPEAAAERLALANDPEERHPIAPAKPCKGEGDTGVGKVRDPDQQHQPAG